MTAPPFIVIGNPENRRISMFQDALARQGCAPARVVSWLELLEDGVGYFGARPVRPKTSSSPL